ncbi:MAG: hypothetical protein E7470_09200 [Ruminococcaceae bacterium]|nr:hypothetical protein [Oscillospiraceae bacterium]
MKKYIITISFLLLLIFTLTCCTASTAGELKHRFEGFTSDSNLIAVLDDFIFYFADHKISLNDIDTRGEPNNGYLFVDGALYFSTAKENGFFDYSLYVYSCDLYGNHQCLVFEKHGFRTHPWVTGSGESLYIEHYSTNTFDASARVIDSYNVVTGVYQTEATGKTTRLSDYRADSNGAYSSTYENGTLFIEDQQSNVTHRVDPTALVYEAFNDALAGFDCNFYDFYATTDDRMFFLYSIKVSGTTYPYLICEYIPTNREIVFRSLIFADDVTYFRIVYL